MCAVTAALAVAHSRARDFVAVSMEHPDEGGKADLNHSFVARLESHQRESRQASQTTHGAPIELSSWQYRTGVSHRYLVVQVQKTATDQRDR